MVNYVQNAKFEHQFWLSIMGDHSRFIRDSLNPTEEKDIEKAIYFIQQFDQFLNQAKALEQTYIPSFSIKVEKIILQLKEFKLSIIGRKLHGRINIHLTTTFLHHMVNELEEYQLVLCYLKMGNIPPIYHDLHHHLMWLIDGSGHTDISQDRLNGDEEPFKDKNLYLTEQFRQFYLKAVELTDYLRTNIRKFPALNHFKNDAEVEISLFKTFLYELEEWELKEEVFDSFTVSMADHMAREEQYYLIKLAKSRDLASNRSFV